ncbi:riboflavin biosynthesis protein RibF [Thermoproteota archaeon]
MTRLFGLKKRKISSLGLGVFDGMHCGHHEIWKRSTALLTFYPHPDIFLAKNKELKMLTTLKELRFYVQDLIVLRFNHEIAKMTARDFLNTILHAQLEPQTIVVGYDFRFGYKQEGDSALLMKWTKEHGIGLEIIKPFPNKETPAKSSLIREKIMQDKFDQARRLLGHSYLVIGTVIKGESRGRELGFPTANLHIHPDKLMPNSGVYQGHVLYRRTPYKALVYIGTKPTFGRHEIHMEVFLDDFKGDLYGKTLKVFIEKKLRNDMCFADKNELIKQMKKDLMVLKTNEGQDPYS